MKGGMGNLMKQAQQMQASIEKAQKELATMEVVGQSGAGMVKITMTGKHDVKRVAIEDALFEDDKEMLEDLIAAAINDAVRQVEQTSQQRMAGMMPAGMKLPF
ncbi:MAG: YbaB/EbfC family nucleoid-associated protein [Gammaproteobacteria bacterium]|nr:YbaB/EbfC family nucleoid-associated protein [Gammaproteobacteria bacterium]